MTRTVHRQLSSAVRKVLTLTLTASLASGAVMIAGTAQADPGPAPEPEEIRVISGVHTDAVSTFFDDGSLALGTKADVDEGTGTRFEADEVWFHITDAAQHELPPGFEFIGPAGTTVWLAPESNPGPGRLWPGFDTQSVEAGAIDGDTTTFTLTDVHGPGDVEVFTGAALTEPTRLWSSQDSDVTSFEVTRTHMHASWAFTEPGTYRLDVEASVTVGGTLQTSEATYTFVVADLPEQVTTTTTLESTATAITAADPITLTARVSPASADGYVDFHDGETLLGHAPVTDGVAELHLTPAIGSHRFTAAFVPAISNLAAASVSEPVAVTVTDLDGTEFAIVGVEDSYEVGDVLTAHVVGHTLGADESYRWLWRPVGEDLEYVLHGTGGEEASGHLELPLDMSYDGYEISVQLQDDNGTIGETAWLPLTVVSDVAPVSPTFPDGDLYLGDEIFVELDGTPAPDDEIRLAFRAGSGPWSPAPDWSARIDDHTLQFTPMFERLDTWWVAQTVRDGVVIAQSEPVLVSVRSREVMVQGLQAVYRVGQTLTAQATVYPTREDLLYRWELRRFDNQTFMWDVRQVAEGSTEADRAIELVLGAEDDGWSLAFHALLVDEQSGTELLVGSHMQQLHVSDADPSTQLLFFESLSGHYHQGDAIDLTLVTDPPLADGDSIAWQWYWPGTDWTAMPDASGLQHVLTAEQALDGVQVSAILTFADGATLTAEPVTIAVDDHGSDPRQHLTITGDAITDGVLTVVENEPPGVIADVSAPTVLDRYRWSITAPGTDEPVVIEGATTPLLDRGLDASVDGAALTVAIIKPDGSIAYGPSEPVVLSVQQAPADPEPEPMPTTDPPTSEVDSTPATTDLDDSSSSGDSAGRGDAPTSEALGADLPITGTTLTTGLGLAGVLLIVGAALVWRRSRHGARR